MINHKHKCIFIHIPGTAGTSIESAFGENIKSSFVKHQTLSDVIKKNPSEYKSYFKFSIVRNPWDLALTMFFKKNRYRKTQKDSIDFISGKHKKFIEFLKEDCPFCFVDWHKNLMSDYLMGDIDFIMRNENLQQDFDIVCDKIKMPHQNLVFKNKCRTRGNNRKHYTEYYNKEAKEIVAEKYAKDIESFVYEFGE